MVWGGCSSRGSRREARTETDTGLVKGATPGQEWAQGRRRGMGKEGGGDRNSLPHRCHARWPQVPKVFALPVVAGGYPASEAVRRVACAYSEVELGGPDSKSSAWPYGHPNGRGVAPTCQLCRQTPTGPSPFCTAERELCSGCTPAVCQVSPHE